MPTPVDISVGDMRERVEVYTFGSGATDSLGQSDASYSKTDTAWAHVNLSVGSTREEGLTEHAETGAQFTFRRRFDIGEDTLLKWGFGWWAVETTRPLGRRSRYLQVDAQQTSQPGGL